MEKTFNAGDLLRDAAMRHGIRLEVLVAETGLWANPEVHKRLSVGGASGAYYPDRRRCRAGQGESRGQKVNSVILDDNTYANAAIKRALGVPRRQLVGFEACHIWPLTCYDERYHTVVANLVLLPRALAGLTDHSPDVQTALQYHAFKLYGWYPDGQPQPIEPSSYPCEWREPMPFSDAVAAVLAKRTLKLQAASFGDIARQTKGRDNTRYDIGIDGRVLQALPKRILMITFVKALVEAGISPGDISVALPALSKRLFRSAEGLLDAERFVAAIASRQEQQGKSFDASRYFCEEDRLIYFEGNTFALTNQWGGWTNDTIATLMRAFPNQGVSIAPTREPSAQDLKS